VSVTIDGMPYLNTTHIGKSIWAPSVDYLGEALFETLVTDDGGFRLRRPGAGSCALKPLEASERGFASGALVTCDEGAAYRVRAHDDTDRGEVRVSVNSQAEELYRYDVDTAVLLSANPPVLGKANTREAPAK